MIESNVSCDVCGSHKSMGDMYRLTIPHNGSEGKEFCSLSCLQTWLTKAIHAQYGSVH